MASNKRKQDEKHLKVLREVVALPHNKQCFDCHQRGPTYINMTIGSFVCTACSGLLRGLNPPHRVKSISMASFTPEEMDFIKCHGNEFCRRVWLGLYDNRLGNQSESRDETKVKDFMVQKYERKRYYVAPTDTMKEEAKKMNESAISKTTPGTKPLKSLLGDNAPKLQVAGQEGEVVEGALATGLEDGVTTMNITGAASQNPFSDDVAPVVDPVSVTEEPKPVSATPPPIGSTPQSPGNQSIQSSKSSGSTAMDLLGDLGGDPFASSAPAQPQGLETFRQNLNLSPPSTTIVPYANSLDPDETASNSPSHPDPSCLTLRHQKSQGGFADFGSFGTSTSQPLAFPHSTPLQPAGSVGSTPTQQQQPPQQAFNGFGAPSSTPAAPAQVPGAGGDKYSALSDLFSTGSVEAQTTSTGWTATVSTGSGGLGWNSSSASSTVTASTAINWGGDSTGSSAPSPGGVNWNSSSSATAPGAGGMSWGGGSSSTASSWGAPQPATAQSNVSNPFGGGSNTSLTSQSAMPGMGAQAPVANPFGGQPGAQQGGFGSFGTPQSSASQPGGFGQFGAPGVATAPGGGAAFGQMGMQNGGFGNPQTTSSAGFGQGFGGAQPGFGQPHQQQQPQQQAAGFGGMPGAGFGGQQGFGAPGAPAGGFGGQQMQGFGAPQQQAGGWGQPAQPGTVNPFMSAAQQQQYSAPKSGATNPFL